MDQMMATRVLYLSKNGIDAHRVDVCKARAAIRRDSAGLRLNLTRTYVAQL